MDRYQNLSPDFEVIYVDPDKNPDVARVEGMHSFGDIVIDNGTKKETAKASPKRRSPAHYPRVQDGPAHGLLRKRFGRTHP